MVLVAGSSGEDFGILWCDCHGWIGDLPPPSCQVVQTRCGSGVLSLWSKWMVGLSNIDLTIPTGDAVHWVFSPGLSLTGHRNLELFLGSRPTLLMMCLNSTLLMQLDGHLEVCYEGDQARFHTWPIGPRLLFDHMPYLLLGVAITPKS